MFTKGVRTLVPRLTHALTSSVSDVFGLNHYTSSLKGGGSGLSAQARGSVPLKMRPADLSCQATAHTLLRTRRH